MIILAAALRVLRRLPNAVRREAAAERRRREMGRYLDAELRSSTWVCELHLDAWRRPDGTFRRVVGSGVATMVMPLSEWDAEDFHGWEEPS